MNNPETQATRYRTKINKTSKATKNTIQKAKNMSSVGANKSWDEQRSSQMVSRFCFLKKLVNVKSYINPLT
jgi:hypothetical protein